MLLGSHCRADGSGWLCRQQEQGSVFPGILGIPMSAVPALGIKCTVPVAALSAGTALVGVQQLQLRWP